MACNNYNSFNLSIVILLHVLCLSFFSALSDASDRERNTSASNDDKITKTYKDQTLSEVLTELGREFSFEFKAPQRLLKYAISGTYAEVPVQTLLNEILVPFDYCIVFDKQNRVKVIYVSNITQSRLQKDETQIQSLKTSTLSESQLEFLNVISKDQELTMNFGSDLSPLIDNIGPSVPEDFVSKYFPEFESEVIAGGPSHSGEPAAELPTFEPFRNKTGPDVEVY